jgi:DNA/RNA-binding domain of Phe-tRNA-synthetase-like protein
MKFTVEKEIFEKLPNACFGIVMARGIDNSADYPEIARLLDESTEAAAQRFDGKKVKEEAEILPYREAFRALGINPNKYLCSIEALFTRIAKGKGMPHINPAVDLGNAVSLKYTLPMGAHDLGDSSEDICIRLSKPGDTFLPFGGDAEETPDIGEVVYAVGNQVRTRRWTWRQSEHGKITEASSDIFFPIDGFTDFNRNKVLAARDELQALASGIWSCETVVGMVDAEHPETEI